MQDRYREIYDAFRWEVPDRFNMAAVCCARWAGDRDRFALYGEHECGAAVAWPFRDIQQQANRRSNARVNRQRHGERRGKS